MNANTTLVGSQANCDAHGFSLSYRRAVVFFLFVTASFWAGKVFSQTKLPGLHEEIEGELIILHEDNNQGGRYHYFLEAAGRRTALSFAKEPPTHLTSGARVRVTGTRIEGALALESGTGSVQLLSSQTVQNNVGEQTTALILVNFQNDPLEPYTLEFARNMVFGTVNSFYLENSFQQTWFSGDVFGWYTIPMNSSNCDGFLIRDYAKQAATAAGKNLAVYKYIVFAFPQNSGCGYDGMAQVGGPNAWINGSLNLKVVGHEFGHLFGLYHSHSLECGAAVIGNNCETWENGDSLDIMGNVAVGHLSSFQKEQLGWLSTNILTVLDSGTYTIDGYELAVGIDPKALKLLKSYDPITGARSWYYLEFRRALGFDAFLTSNGNVLNGVVVHTGDDGNLNSGRLLDMTPGSSWLETEDWNDPALTLGWTFTDPSAGVSISPIAVNGNTMVVSVTASNASCVTATPSISLSPSQGQAVLAGTPVTYTVTVTDNDAAQCSAASVNIQAKLPTNWTGVLANPNMTLNPGEIRSTTLTTTSSTGSGAGTYPITVTAVKTTNANQTASASASYVVASPLNVTVTTSQPSYNRTQTVTISAKVSNGTTPAANAKVVFTIRKANGSIVTATATTGKNGEATYKFRLKQQDPLGTYQVTVDANLNNTMLGRGTTSFNVI